MLLIALPTPKTAMSGHYESKMRSKNVRPLKEVYGEELLTELKANEARKDTVGSSSSRLKKLSPFQNEK